MSLHMTLNETIKHFKKLIDFFQLIVSALFKEMREFPSILSDL